MTEEEYEFRVEALVRLVQDLERRNKELRDEMNLIIPTVSAWVKDINEIALELTFPGLAFKRCLLCEWPFFPKRNDHKFCSESCHDKYHNGTDTTTPAALTAELKAKIRYKWEVRGGQHEIIE